MLGMMPIKFGHDGHLTQRPAKRISAIGMV
jgi:hypothetical protein